MPALCLHVFHYQFLQLQECCPQELLKWLLGEKRKIDIILTTHNPVLLNGYKKQQLLGVSVVYRENEKGTSKFIPFVDIRNYPQVFVRGGLGEAMLDESLLNLIKCPSEKKDYSWMEDF